MKFRLFAGCLSAFAVVCSVSTAHADSWWPVDVTSVAEGGKIVSYQPMGKASRPWKLCVVVPHMKDSFWTALDYGVVDQARQQGVNLALYEAGGYDQLPKQLSQFDDCMASGADAIILGAISEAGLKQKLDEAAKAKKPVIATANPVINAPITGRVWSDFAAQGAATGTALLKRLSGASAKAVAFPGPQGSGWAETQLGGFMQSLKGSQVTVLSQKFGDPEVNAQMRLVQDALQAYPDMSVIYGTAPTAEAAINAVDEIGKKDMIIVSPYENQALLDAVRNGDIYGFATAYSVLCGRIAVDMAVRALEDKLTLAYVTIIPRFVTKSTINEANLPLVFAPADWKPVYNVKAGN